MPSGHKNVKIREIAISYIKTKFLAVFFAFGLLVAFSLVIIGLSVQKIVWL
jgi:hypothetical protein